MMRRKDIFKYVVQSILMKSSERRAIAKKAAQKRKWRKAAAKAHKTAKNAKTFTKYYLNKKGYRCIDFDSRKGHEWKGIVDLFAVKQGNKNPDNLSIALLQVKGGKAKVSGSEISRLKRAVKNVKIGWNCAEKPSNKVNFKKEIAWGSLNPFSGVEG